MTSHSEFDLIYDRFESGWTAEPGRIESFLEQVSTVNRATVLRGLLEIEFELILRNSQQPDLAAYVRRFPDAVVEINDALRKTEGRLAGGDSCLRSANRADASGSSSATPVSADRNLLFGVLAWQSGVINERQLLDGIKQWTFDKARPLSDALMQIGAVSGDQVQLLQPMVDAQIRLHKNDTKEALNSLSAVSGIAEALKQQISDEDVQHSLGHLAPTIVPSRSVGEQARSGEQSASTRFRARAFHAAGGLGEVYRASDEELNREVALKQMKPEYAHDSNGRARFLLEAEITGSLEHPGIVPVYGLGTYADGRPFYAMRFIKGQSLKEAIDEFHGKTPATDEKQKAESGERKAEAAGHSNNTQVRKPDFESLEFRKLLGRFIDVCQAVSYAHSRGVLHRDLKPGNVMLGKYGETLVVDWGLAKVKGRADPDKTPDEQTLRPSSGSGIDQTLDGKALGTPAYMSPEQARGDLESLGPQTDVYSLGATLYHMLNGSPPYVGVPFAQFVAMVRNNTLTLPEATVQFLPRQLRAICMKAMSAGPEERYSNPRELADDLERYLADEAVLALRESFVERSIRWSRKNIRLVITSVAAVTIVAITIVSSLYLNWSASREVFEAKTLVAQREAETERTQRQLSETRERMAQRDAVLLQLVPVRATSREAEARLQLIEDATKQEYMDAAARCDLLLAKYDVLRSIQHIDEALGVLADIKPISIGQQQQVLLRQLHMEVNNEQRHELATRLLQGKEVLQPEEVTYVTAILTPDRAERIRLLDEAVALRADFPAAREFLVSECLWAGETQRVYSLCHEGHLLWPADLFYQITPVIAAAFAGDEVALTRHREQLVALLNSTEDKRLFELIDELRKLPTIGDGWDTGAGIDITYISTVLKFASFSFSISESSPVVSDALHRMRLTSVESNGLVTGPRLAFAMSALLLGNTAPVTGILSDNETDSPIAGDAFFSFVRGAIHIAFVQTEDAERELEEAVVRPSVIPNFRREALYALAMTQKRRFLETRDENYLRKTGETFERWLNSGPRLDALRLKYAIMISLQAERPDVARGFLEYGRVHLPNARVEELTGELRILNHERHFLRIIDLTGEAVPAEIKASLSAEDLALLESLHVRAKEQLLLEARKYQPLEPPTE